jgi:hypothetical protein
MQSNIHGLISISLFFMAVSVAMGAVIPKSIILSLIYLLIVILCFVNIVISYCSKCTCKEKECSHLFPGLLAKYFPNKKINKYSYLDIFVTLISLSAILIIPHFWLIYNIPSLILFWIFIVTSFLEKILFVCHECSNVNCILAKRKVKIKK